MTNSYWLLQYLVQVSWIFMIFISAIEMKSDFISPFVLGHANLIFMSVLFEVSSNNPYPTFPTHIGDIVSCGWLFYHNFELQSQVANGTPWKFWI